MTRNLSKVTAALLATLTISATAISFDTASAGMRSGGMSRMSGGMDRGLGRGDRVGHMGRMHAGHMGHSDRRHGCCRYYGRGMAGVGGAIALGAVIVAANEPYAELYDPETGERVRSSGKPRRHVVTRTDRDGNKVTKVNKPEPDSASSFDPKTGVTTTSTSNGNGTRTVTTDDGKGNVNTTISGGEPASASATDTTTGATATSTSNGGGTRTVTTDDGKGNTNTKISGREANSASSTDPKTGVTTTSISNGNGTRTVVQTDASGKVLSSEVVN
jgi:hypothetical protein